MEISYHPSFFYSYSLAYRHLQVAFSDGASESIEKLWNRGIISCCESYPQSLLGRVKHVLLAFSECIPVIGVIVAYFDKLCNKVKKTLPFPPSLEKSIRQIVEETPKFNSYAFGANPDTSNKVLLTDIYTRPANLLYEAILPKQWQPTLPGSHQLFAFPKKTSFGFFAPYFSFQNPTYEITAKGKETFLHDSTDMVELEKFLGSKTYKISHKEILSMQASQEIWVSPLLPKKFYLEMKKVLNDAGIVELPKQIFEIHTLEKLMGIHSVSFLKKFLGKVEKNPQLYGFDTKPSAQFSFEELKNLTLYQLGSMIVKKEDYRSLVGNRYEISERNVGDKDAISLISASGIRNFHSTSKIFGNECHQTDQKIMQGTFETVFKASGKNSDVIFPAVGMGVWSGDPEIYWRAFLEAVVKGADETTWIYINPGHQKTTRGKWKGYGGEEFAELLSEFRSTYPENKNLGKIVNLFNKKTDILLLAQNLKKAQPDKTVALINASDPDVTLGGHVGEYVNNIHHPPTTEENFAAAGTSGLGFEHLTKVLEDENRIHQG